MNLSNFLFILFIVLSNTQLIGQSILQSKLDRILQSTEFKHSSVSIAIIDIEAGNLIASYNPEMSIIPASSLKVLTTLTAVEILQDSFQFNTTISYDGTIEGDGTLIGNIYIEGSGDPTFGSQKFKPEMAYDKLFKKIASKIQKEGITCIDGQIIADESIFNSYPISPSWQWNDLGNYYASGAWGININENEYAVYFDQRATIGKRPRVKYTDPVIPHLQLSNELLVDGPNTGDNAYIFGGPYNYDKRIVGTIPQGAGTFRIKGSIPDPPHFSAHLLKQALEKKGIKSNDIEVKFHSDSKVKRRKKLLNIKSPYLFDIAKKANFTSNNLYCEAILKRLGLEKRGQGSGQNGIAAIKTNLKNHGINTDALNMEDGSGLSARNNTSAILLAKFLQKFSQKNGIEKTQSLLPKAGVQGTVASILRNSKARGKVWMKSGSMNRVTSYTGIIKNANDEWKSFCILINGYDCKGSVMRGKAAKIIDLIYRG